MKNSSRTLAGMGAALIITLIYIHVSQMIGRLGHDITYDDIGYVNDANDRLALLFTHGICSFLHSFQSQPPHSPFSTLLAMAALALGGYQDAVFYVANSLLLVATTLFLIREFACDKAGSIIWIVTAFLCSPLAYNSIVHFRPDYAVGLATTAMIWWFANGLFRGKSGSFKLAGLAFGAALLIKPTFFAHTLAMAAGLMALFCLVRYWTRFRARESRVSPWSSVLYFSGIGIAVASPYYVYGGHAIFDYFWTNTRGIHSQLWSFPADTSLLALAHTYLFDTYQHAIGFHLPLATLLAVNGAIFFASKRMRPELAILVTLVGFAVASFLILLIGRHKNDFFFATFQALFLLAGFHSFFGIYSASKGAAKWAFLGISWAALAIAVELNLSDEHEAIPSEDSLNQSWNYRVASLISDAVEKSRIGSALDLKPVRIFVTVPGPVNSHTVKWIATKKGIRVEPVDFYMTEVLSEYIERVQNSDFVVIPNGAYAEYYRDFPSTAVQPALAKAITNDPLFKQLGPTDPIAHYLVFENTRLKAPRVSVINVPPLTSVSGFRTEEGPYPQWQLPRVQWMSQSVAKLCVNEPGGYSAQLRFRSDVPGELSVTSEHAAPLILGPFSPGQFVNYSFSRTFTSDDPCLEFRPAFSSAPAADHVLLFTKLQIQKLDGQIQ